MPVYISQEGLEELKREHVLRTRETRRVIADAISSAKELGDLSENFEYQDAKEQQSLNEARILQVEAMIQQAVIVEETSGGEQIELGCTFIAQVHGVEKTFSLVGSMEADPLAGKISNESPLGRALMGRAKGDVVCVTVPNGTIEYTILKIK